MTPSLMNLASPSSPARTGRPLRAAAARRASQALRSGAPLGMPRDAWAADALACALDLLLTHRGRPTALVDAVLARYPDHVDAHRIRAGLIVAGGNLTARAELAASLAVIATARPDAAHADRRHAAAAEAWLQGCPDRSLDGYGALIIEQPHDLLALLVAHALDFRLGRRRMLRDRVAQILPAWRAGMPGHASVLAMYAFGLAENHELRRAESVARRALAVDATHPGAVHVVAHVMDMQGRSAEGLAFMQSHEEACLAPTGFGVHLDWHRALFHLDLDDAAAALAVYDRRAADPTSIGASVLADASALLWRLSLDGIDVGGRWRELADRWQQQRLAGAGMFVATHAMMAFAATGRADAAARVLEDLRSDAAHRLHPEGQLAAPLCDALMAFGAGRYDACARLLGAVRDIAHRCGGSLAQCDVVQRTHTEAALRAGDTPLARALVAERAAQRPASRHTRRLRRRLRRLSAPHASASITSSRP